MSETSETPTPQSETKDQTPTRNPLEKVVVWGAIAIGLIVVTIEARG